MEAAVQTAMATHGEDIAAISSGTFPLPTLGPVLVSLRERLINGLGFALIRGLPIERFSRRQAATLFFGVGTHLGRARSQNAAGHILGHVRDAGKAATDTDVRIYQTRERQTFHTDSADVVA
ncbi:MAG: TauD/TfdA family dioxygenase, partial [Rhodospirillales bacterium]|nr:TauD/TfdA family dioxygenase [Rhodospirillales bacterium]